MAGACASVLSIGIARLVPRHPGPVLRQCWCAPSHKLRNSHALPSRRPCSLFGRPCRTGSPSRANERILRPDLDPLFTQNGQSGCFALLDIAADRLTLVNTSRVETRFVPASSFKIANSLIALETGVIRDENEIIPAGPAPNQSRHGKKTVLSARASPSRMCRFFRNWPAASALPLSRMAHAPELWQCRDRQCD